MAARDQAGRASALGLTSGRLARGQEPLMHLGLSLGRGKRRVPRPTKRHLHVSHAARLLMDIKPDLMSYGAQVNVPGMSDATHCGLHVSPQRSRALNGRASADPMVMVMLSSSETRPRPFAKAIVRDEPARGFQDDLMLSRIC